MILVTPAWQTQSWYPQLLHLSKADPILLPQYRPGVSGITGVVRNKLIPFDVVQYISDLVFNGLGGWTVLNLTSIIYSYNLIYTAGAWHPGVIPNFRF